MSEIRLIESRYDSRIEQQYTPIVKIYVDASSIKNGSIEASAGCGAVLLDENRLELKLVAKHLVSTTNQQAEILACAIALEELRRCCRVEIVYDSRYVIDTMMGRSSMDTNRPIWTRLIQSCYGHHISWRWVKGHSGDPFQEVADRLARAAAKVNRDLSAEDLENLSRNLSKGSGDLDIRAFEMELEKVVSRYSIADKSFVPAARFDGTGILPSAFSA